MDRTAFIVHIQLKLFDELLIAHIREHMAAAPTARVRIDLRHLRNHLRLSVLEDGEWDVEKVLFRVEGLAALGRALVEARSQDALLRVGGAVVRRVRLLLLSQLSFLLALVALFLHHILILTGLRASND